MSNNIYDILKKFNSLDSVKNMLSEGKKVCKDCGEVKCKCIDESKGSKPDFLDMDKDGDKKEPMKKAAKEKSKGAIAEAVARVEKQLAEKYQGFKKLGENEYDKYSEVQPEHIKARPGSSDPMGTADYQTGIKPDPDDTLLGVYGPKAQITPKISGIAPEKRSDVLRQKYNNRLGSGQQRDDIFLNEPKGNETYNDLLKGADHYTSFSPKKPSMMDRAKSALGLDEGEYNEDMLSPGQKKIARMSPPPNKIDAGDLAKLRSGKKDMKKEGNAFSGAMVKAKASGQDEFNVDGKTYPVKENRRAVKEWGLELDDPQHTGAYDYQMSPADQERFKAMPKNSGPESEKVRQYYEKNPDKSSYGLSQSWDLDKADYVDRLNSLRQAKVAANELTPSQWLDKFKNVVGKPFGRQETPIRTAKTAMDLDGPTGGSPGASLGHNYVGTEPKNYTPTMGKEFNQKYKDAQKRLFPDQVKEGFPTVDDAKKRMDAKAGKTAHGTKTVTKTGVKHERNYDADEPTGERGRPKKDKFAK